MKSTPMDDTTRLAMIAYLQEQRRHLLAQVKATETLLEALRKVRSSEFVDTCYNNLSARVAETK
jgi:hypothetical protein